MESFGGVSTLAQVLIKSSAHNPEYRYAIRREGNILGVINSRFQLNELTVDDSEVRTEQFLVVHRKIFFELRLLPFISLQVHD